MGTPVSMLACKDCSCVLFQQITYAQDKLRLKHRYCKSCRKPKQVYIDDQWVDFDMLMSGKDGLVLVDSDWQLQQLRCMAMFEAYASKCIGYSEAGEYVRMLFFKSNNNLQNVDKKSELMGFIVFDKQHLPRDKLFVKEFYVKRSSKDSLKLAFELLDQLLEKHPTINIISTGIYHQHVQEMLQKYCESKSSLMYAA